MIRSVAENTWAFDLEWAPDPSTGRRVYNLPADMSDEEVLRVMWERGGATDEEPQPYLKTSLCRVVSAAIVRRKHRDGKPPALTLASLPHSDSPAMPERQLLSLFLTQLGHDEPKPTLVGFNSRSCDLPILIQRGIAHGISAPAFCHRPNKPWEGVDYFGKNSEGHVDLKEIVGGWGKATPSLHEVAAAAGIPGKMDTTGDDVINLWQAGDIHTIVAYNQFDALSTYLVWLRTALFAGLMSPEQHAAEEECVREMLARRVAGGEAHLQRYLDKWAALSATRELP